MVLSNGRWWVWCRLFMVAGVLSAVWISGSGDWERGMGNVNVNGARQARVPEGRIFIPSRHLKSTPGVCSPWKRGDGICGQTDDLKLAGFSFDLISPAVVEYFCQSLSRYFYRVFDILPRFSSIRNIAVPVAHKYEVAFKLRKHLVEVIHFCLFV